MTNKPSKKVAVALAAYAAAYRECFAAKLACVNFDAAVAYAVADMFNQAKHSSEENAIFLINDETAYLLERRAA